MTTTITTPTFRIDPSLHKEDIDIAVSAILDGQSFLLIGNQGCGKTTIGRRVQGILEDHGYSVYWMDYKGSSLESLKRVAEQIGIEPNQKTEVLREVIANSIADTQKKVVLIADNAERYPSTQRFWLQEAIKRGAVVLTLATKPPRKDFFTILARRAISMPSTTAVRQTMIDHAENLGIRLTTDQLANLESKAGGNLEQAKKVVFESKLGIDEVADHGTYIDGTPILISLLAMTTLLRFMGLGFRDRGLYILGGILTIFSFTLRIILAQLNKASNKME